jgi:hypothetical protein
MRCACARGKVVRGMHVPPQPCIVKGPIPRALGGGFMARRVLLAKLWRGFCRVYDNCTDAHGRVVHPAVVKRAWRRYSGAVDALLRA